VGIAVVVGVTMFNSYAVSANQDAVTNDLINLGARAQAFYRKPVMLGGGGNRFTGLTLRNLVQQASGNTWTNPNGSYHLQTDPVTDSSQVIIIGTGVEKVDGQPIQVLCRVTPDSLVTIVSTEVSQEIGGPQ
jgi:hypothetical protein